MKELSYNFFLKLKISVSVVFFVLLTSVCFAPTYGSSGNYLVAINAAGKNDFEFAARNYLSVLKDSGEDPLILQETLLFSVLANDIELALKLSALAEKQGLQIPTAGLISLVGHLKNKEFTEAQTLVSRYEETLPKFFSTLVYGWIEIENGSFDSGIKLFRSLDTSSRQIGLYNCAIAFAMSGEFQSALRFIEELDDKKVKFDDKQLQAVVQIYSNNNLNEKAIELINFQGKDKNSGIFVEILLGLKNKKKLRFSAFSTPSDALANVFYLMGNTGEKIKKSPIASIFYIQLAELLTANKDYYNIRLAEIFADMKAFQYSIKKFDNISPGSPFYLRAQLGSADTLVQKGQRSQGRRILQQLISDGFNEFVIFDSLADIFRANEDYETAIEYYDIALNLLSEEARRKKWATFFVRGISYDQSGDWEKAKIDLENALNLSPNHPEVLNYYGYSLIERNESLERALGMIESAVSQRPESGYIIDSLAWGLFRLGQYQKAIGPMERAIQLEPHDPIVNDHLGDVLWMIGRKREAEFQWRRALLFGPTIENEEKIKKKLRYGITDL